jgi:hypothetical protein
MTRLPSGRAARRMTTKAALFTWRIEVITWLVTLIVTKPETPEFTSKVIYSARWTTMQPQIMQLANFITLPHMMSRFQ